MTDQCISLCLHKKDQKLIFKVLSIGKDLILFIKFVHELNLRYKSIKGKECMLAYIIFPMQEHCSSNKVRNMTICSYLIPPENLLFMEFNPTYYENLVSLFW